MNERDTSTATKWGHITHWTVSGQVTIFWRKHLHFEKLTAPTSYAEIVISVSKDLFLNLFVLYIQINCRITILNQQIAV